MEDKVDFVRVLRVLEYSGPRTWVEQTLERNAIKGTFTTENGGRITSAILGTFPEILTQKDLSK